MTSKRAVPRTPEPVDGRRHADIQTDVYLEELADTVPESDVTTQTDAFLDRPPTPLFVPAKAGMDVVTQIEPGVPVDRVCDILRGPCQLVSNTSTIC